MSLNFTTDQSVQLSYSSFGFTTPKLDNFATSNYVSNVSNVLKANIDTKQDILTFSSPMTKSVANNVTINLGSYSTTGNDPNYLLRSGGSMTGNLGITSASGFLGFGTRNQDFLIKLSGEVYGFGVNPLTLRYNADTTASHKFYSGTVNTATINSSGNITATSFSGNGANITNVPYSSITGTPIIYTQTQTDSLLNAKESILTFNAPLTRTTNTIGINLGSYYNKTDTDTLLNAKQPTLTAATSLLGIGSNLTLVNYNTLSNLPNIYTQTQTDNLLNAKEAILTFNAPLTRTTNTIGINLGSYYNKTDTDTLLNAKQPTLTAAITLLGIGSNLTLVNYNTLSNLPNIYTQTQTDNLLNAKEAILTFNAPLTRTTNTIGINLSSYSTTGNDTNYLLKTGGTLTGPLTGTTITAAKVSSSDATGVNASCLGRLLNVVGTNAVMRIWRNDGNNSPSMEFISGITSTATITWFWDMYIGGTTGNNFFAIRDRRPGGTNPVRFIIDTNGNTAIGPTVNTSYKLTVSGAFNATSIYNNGTLITFSSYATNTNLTTNYYNKTDVNGLSTLTNFYNKTDSDGRYLQLTGGTLSGALTVNSDTTINGILKLKNSEWIKSIDNVNRIYFANNGFSYYGNGGGVLGHVFLNNSSGNILELYNDNSAQLNGTLRVNQYITSKCCDSFGEDFNYIVNWNGTNSSGWFIGLNRFWYTGHTCLNVSITALNAGGKQDICWFGRVYLSHAAGTNTGTPPAVNGGIIQIITDYRYPASWTPTNYYITVGEKWDGQGNNTLYVYLSNPNYAGTLRVKIRG